MKTEYEVFESSRRGSRLLWQEAIILEVLEALCSALSSENISKTELAQKLGKTKGFISQIFAGGRNLTLRTIADVCWALGYVPRFRLCKEKAALPIPSFTRTIHEVDWESEQPEHEPEVKVGEVPNQVSEAMRAANQELGVAA